MKTAWTDDLHVLLWFFCLSILSVLGSSLLCKATHIGYWNSTNKTKNLDSGKIQAKSKLLLRMCVPPQSSLCWTAVTFSSLKTNTDSEQVVFLNNTFAPSCIILACLGCRDCTALLHKWKQFSWDIANLSQWKAREIYCIRSISALTDSGMSFH